VREGGGFDLAGMAENVGISVRCGGWGACIAFFLGGV